MDERPRPLFAAATNVPGGYRYGAQAGAASVLIHIGVVALLFTLTGGRPSRTPARERPWRVTRLVLPVPYQFPARDDGGGGGGGRTALPASQGLLPRFTDRQFVPPRPVARDESFAFLMEPTLVGRADAQTPKVDAGMWGEPAALPGPPSPGPGDNGGIGNGDNGGVGSHRGPGWGPGEHPGGYTGVVVPGRGGVSAPIPIYKVEPDYSEEARKAHFQGTVEIEIVIDERGYPTNFKS